MCKYNKINYKRGLFLWYVKHIFQQFINLKMSMKANFSDTKKGGCFLPPFPLILFQLKRIA